jgi:hypothetical protein
LAERQIYQWAGVGFGEQTYRLQKSIKQLAAAKQAKSVRFFGKVFGTERDYYIVEAEVEGGEEEPVEELEEGKVAPEQEPKGQGVNKYTYFVTHDSLSAWIKLPDLTVDQLKAARMIKVMFTGDLERKIYTNPCFFG